jgi:putative endonuclease
VNPVRRPDEPGEVKRRKSLGNAGESIARKYLESKGYRILESNFRRRSGEIDIVALDRRILVFCEVKTRLGDADAAEGYSVRQQRRMVEMSQKFLAENEDILPYEFELRFDVVVVGDGTGGVLEVKDHIADAFRPQ